MSSIEEASDDSDELYEHFKIEVDPGQALLRIDKFLMDRIPDISRSRLQAAAKAEALLVNDKPVKSNYKVKPSDVIQLLLPFQKRELELISEDLPLDIVYEDDSLILLNKQAGLVVHPGHGNYTGTLVKRADSSLRKPSKYRRCKSPGPRAPTRQTDDRFNGGGQNGFGND